MRGKILKGLTLIVTLVVGSKVLFSTLLFLCNSGDVESIKNVPLNCQRSERFKKEELSESVALTARNNSLDKLEEKTKDSLKFRYSSLDDKMKEKALKIEQEREKEKEILLKANKDTDSKLTSMLDRLYSKTAIIEEVPDTEVTNQGTFVPTLIGNDLIEISSVKEELEGSGFYDTIASYFTDYQMTQIKIMLPSLMIGYLRTGVFPSVSFSQFAIECSWGDNYLWTEYNNGYGIKADSSWEGASVSCVTHEVFSGDDVTITDAFRVYPSKQEGTLGLCNFLRQNSRYDEAGVFNAPDGEEQIRRIHHAGYATSPTYSDDIIFGLMRPHNMNLIDKKAIEMREGILVKKFQ